MNSNSLSGCRLCRIYLNFVLSLLETKVNQASRNYSICAAYGDNLNSYLAQTHIFVYNVLLKISNFKHLVMLVVKATHSDALYVKPSTTKRG